MQKNQQPDIWNWLNPVSSFHCSRKSHSGSSRNSEIWGHFSQSVQVCFGNVPFGICKIMLQNELMEESDFVIVM